MESEEKVAGIAAISIILAAAIISAAFWPAMQYPKQIYEKYFDMFVVVGLVAISAFLFLLSLRAYHRSGNPRIAYVSGAFLLYTVRNVLALLDIFAGPNIWLVDSAAHILDLGILLLFFTGVVER